MRLLTREHAKAFYDRFGVRQDWQAFYENPALEDLIAHADFGHAERVFEFGCGTGRLGTRLLQHHLSPDARYEGIDLSTTMVALAQARVAAFAPRAIVRRSDGSIAFGVNPGSVDRVLFTYVLDLLPKPDIRAFFAEAHRALRPAGRLCLVGLTRAATWPSTLVLAAWMGLLRLHPVSWGAAAPWSC